jgi:hypothetical protein
LALGCVSCLSGGVSIRAWFGVAYLAVLVCGAWSLAACLVLFGLFVWLGFFYLAVFSHRAWFVVACLAWFGLPALLGLSTRRPWSVACVSWRTVWRRLGLVRGWLLSAVRGFGCLPCLDFLRGGLGLWRVASAFLRGGVWPWCGGVAARAVLRRLLLGERVYTADNPRPRPARRVATRTITFLFSIGPLSASTKPSANQIDAVSPRRAGCCRDKTTLSA